MSAWVPWKTILWMSFSNCNLCFCLWYSELLQDKILLKSSSLPSRLHFLTTISELWPLIPFKCSWWVLLFCLLLWFSEHFLFHFFFPFPPPHFTLCSTLSCSSLYNLPHLEGRSHHSLPPSLSSQVSYLGTLI